MGSSGLNQRPQFGPAGVWRQHTLGWVVHALRIPYLSQFFNLVSKDPQRSASGRAARHLFARHRFPRTLTRLRGIPSSGFETRRHVYMTFFPTRHSAAAPLRPTTAPDRSLRIFDRNDIYSLTSSFSLKESTSTLHAGRTLPAPDAAAQSHRVPHDISTAAGQSVGTLHGSMKPPAFQISDPRR